VRWHAAESLLLIAPGGRPMLSLRPMDSGRVRAYVAGFETRCAAMRGTDQRDVHGPGIHGLLSSIEAPRTRLLVTDDRALGVLEAVLPDARAGMISVFQVAERCAALTRRQRSWEPNAATAMVCRDLRLVPALALPSGLNLRPVARLPADPPDGVPLEEAVAVAMLASSPTADPPPGLADYLRSLPPAIRLFAAVDGSGVVRATSAAGAFGSHATAMFINTHPGWRRRGIGLAMTAAALRTVRASGARCACLDASDAGARIYQRLGFEVVAKTTRFFSTPF
jgi:ribosomal protein S18 acetylase RimI-like enzyme